MATLVLTAVGSAFGPLGGAIGALVGQQIDQRLFGTGSREGPRLKELSVTTSSYGQPVPRHFGRMRVPGTIIWSTELAESTSKEGGGKGKPSTKTYSYSVSFAVAISSTPIDRIGRIWADGELLRGAGGDLKAEGTMRTYAGSGDTPVDPLIAADKGAMSPGFRDFAYVVFEDLQLAEFGNRIPALTFEVFALKDLSVSLSDLVPQSKEVSSDQILKNALGYSDEGGAIGSSLAAIDRVFPLKCTTTANGLALASTNAMPAQTPILPEQLSSRSSEDAEERNRQRGKVLGTEPLALRYYDQDRDYQPGVQRALGLRPEGRETMVELPVTLTAQGARELANSNAHRARWSNEQIIWKMGELNPEITAGSVVQVPDAPGYWLVRSWEWFEKGIELSLERFAPELLPPTASDAGAALVPLDQLATPTLLSAFEIPQDGFESPSSPAIFAAVSSQGSGWRGAALFAEEGDTLTGIGSSNTRRATMGTLLEPLTPSSSTVIEPSAEIELQLQSADLAFASTDVTGLAMGANRLLIGGEVLQFLEASSMGTDNWKLSGLLRGRAGTEDAATVEHPAGTLVAMLDETLTALDPAAVNSSSNTRIAAIGRADSEPVYADLHNAGLSRRPPMPVLPRKMTAEDGTWTFCWIRRARGHWRWPEASEVPMVEEQEIYEVGYGPCAAPFAFWNVFTNQFTLAPTERANLLSQYGPDSLWVRQIGTFGPSSPLLLASIS